MPSVEVRNTVGIGRMEHTGLLVCKVTLFFPSGIMNTEVEKSKVLQTFLSAPHHLFYSVDLVILRVHCVRVRQILYIHTNRHAQTHNNCL
jgi:hypothetical protein